MSDTDLTKEQGLNASGFHLVMLEIETDIALARDGDASYQVFLDAFKRLVSSQEFNKYLCHVARGFVTCPICSEFSYTKIDGEKAYINQADIWIPDFDSMSIYAAPFLLVHLVLNHGYAPSEAYQRAIVKLDVSREFNAKHFAGY